MKIFCRVMPWRGHLKKKPGERSCPASNLPKNQLKDFGFRIAELKSEIAIPQSAINYSYSFSMFLTSSGATLP